MKNLIIASVSTNVEEIRKDQFVDIFMDGDDLGAEAFDVFSIEELQAQKEALTQIKNHVESFKPEIEGLINLLSMLTK